MERILVVKLADLGDLLSATPALRALRTRFPAAEISALVTPHTAALLEGNDAVNDTILFPKARFDRIADLLRPAHGADAVSAALGLAGQLRAAGFDTVVLLHHLYTSWGRLKYRALLAAVGAPVRAGLQHGSGGFLTHRAPDEGFGARHEVEYWLEVVQTIGATVAEPRVELHLRADELEAADARWRSLGLEGHDVVLLHPGSGKFSVARRWGPQQFAAVADSLAGLGLRVGIIAGLDEEGLAAEAQRAMRSPAAVISGLGGPRELAAVLRRARLFVGNDSGVLHSAAAMQVPIVGVYGPSNHRAWGPYPPEQHRVVRLDLACSPCFYRGLSMGTPAGCAPRTCLRELDAERVIDAARELLAGSVRTYNGSEDVGAKRSVDG